MKPTPNALAIIEQASSLAITNAEQVAEATEFLSRANKALDTLEAEEDKIIAPARLIIKTEQAKRAPFKKGLKDVIALVRTKLSAYQTEALKQAQVESERIAARVEKGTLRVETAVRKLGEVDTPEAKVQAESGSLSFRSKPTLSITDVILIPRKYLIPNEDAIFKALQAGTDVPGAEIVIIQTVVNKRK